MLAEQVVDIPAHSAAFDQVLEKISLFGGLSHRQLDLLLPYLKFSDFSEGDCVFKQGQLPSCVYIVVSGKVRLNIKREDGTTCGIDYVAGDCFGETSVIGIQPQLGSAFAEENTEVVVLSRSCLLDVVKYDPQMFASLMMNMAREVSRRFHSSLLAPQNSEELPVLRA